MTEHLGEPDLSGAEQGLIAGTGDGRVRRIPAGDGSLWELAG